MDVLRPWLGLAVQCELDAVVLWRKSAALKSQSEAVGEVIYEDDGSNLRVASPRIGVVQIIEFQTYEEPIQALISDSHTSIQATFTASAVSKYTAVTRKRITDGTRGGLVQIHAFEIVATHYGPKQSRLTLLIKDFQCLGSDGSGTFGNPLPIGSRREISVALSQLGEFRSREPTTSQPQSDLEDDASASDIRSQATDGPSDDEPDVVTQAGFATQGTSSKNNRKGGSELRIPPKATNNTNATITNSPSRKSSVNPLRSGIGSKSSNEALLNLLTLKNKSVRVPMSNVATVPSLYQGLSKVSVQDIQDNTKASDHVHSEFPHSLAHSEVPGKAMIQDTILMATQPAQPEATQSPGSVNGRFQKDLQVPFLDPLNTQSLSVDSGPTMRGSGADLPKDRPNRDMIDLSEHVLPSGPDVSPQEMGENVNDAEEHPWEGMARISRRDVTISRDQQTLLDRQDSWLPPEPGHRWPVANIPIAALQSLNALAERRATQAKRAKAYRQSLEIPDGRLVKRGTQVPISSDEESEEAQESDVLVSSSEWPPSSPPPLLKRHELPPDSSAASPKPPAAAYMAETIGTQGRASLVPSRRGSDSPPHDASMQYQATGSSTQPSQNLSQQHPNHDGGNVASMNGSLYGSVDHPSTRTNTGSSPQQQAWSYQLGNAARVPPISDRSSRARDVTHSKRNAHLAGLSTGDFIEILSQDDEMSDSDTSLLETSVPLALDDLPNSVGVISGTTTVLSHAYPSTVSQENKPVIQVKRTPNTSGQVSKRTIMQLAAEPLHVARDDGLLLESEQAKRLSKGAESSDPVVPGIFSAQPATRDGNVDSAMLAIDVADNHSVTYDEEALVNQQIQSEVDAQSLRSASVSPVKHETKFPGLQAAGQSVTQAMPSKSPVKAEPDTKRKAEDCDVLSPNITKRRKRFQRPAAFNFSQDQQEIQDPSVLARQQRREFFASRKVSVLQSNIGSSIEVHEEEALEAEDLTTGLSEVSKEDEDVVMDLDHQVVEMDLSSDLSQSHDMASETGISALKTLEERSPLVRQPNIPKPAVKVCRTAAIEHIEDHVIEPPEIDATIASTAGRIYDRFRATYSEYTGDLDHFIAMAQKIDTLRSEDRMEHRSLWDDFIVRHKMEYHQYLLECMEKAEDPIPYERFYRDEVDEPKFTKKVITPNNLADVLALAGFTSRTEQPRRSGVERQPASTSGSPAPVEYRPTPSRIGGVIDLTADNQEHRRRAEPKILTPIRSAKKGPRPIPWAQPVVKSDISPPARRKATPGSAGSSQSHPLPFLSQTSFKLPISASGSPLRPRSARTDASPPAALRKDRAKPRSNSDLVKNGTFGAAQQDRSSVTDWLDRTSTHGVVKEGAPPSTADWWTDANAPFKSFARAYVSIESGKGNSFAKAGVQGYKKIGRVDSEGFVWPKEKGLDVLSWKV